MRTRHKTWIKGRKVQKAFVDEGKSVSFKSGSTYFSYKGSLRRVYVGNVNKESAIKVNGEFKLIKDLKP